MNHSEPLVNKKPKITVVGSINMDLVVTSSKWPVPGETFEGNNFEVFSGGKGANQAVAAARAGGKVTFLGAVGSDDYGKMALENLRNNNVIVDNIKISQRDTTGKAIITVVDAENSIIYIPGANRSIDDIYIKENLSHISSADIVLMQNEIPFEVQKLVAEYCSNLGVTLIYNPAPARKIDSWFLEKVTYVTPNEHELSVLLDQPQKDTFLKKVICTRGNKGVEFYQSGIKKQIPSFTVDVMDTTGAGDTFNGVLAVELASKKNLEEALLVANIAAALSITKKGAQEGMPTREEILSKSIMHKIVRN